MRRFAITAILALACVPAGAMAQLKTQDAAQQDYARMLGQGRAGNLVSMLGLDPARFSMQHSYSLSFMSAGDRTFGQGVYLNTMHYQLSAPLSVQLQWGILHEPMQGAGVSSPFTSGAFVSGASMEYNPSKNVKVGIEYSRYPAGRAGYGYGYGRGYGYGYGLRQSRPGTLPWNATPAEKKREF